MGNGQANGSAAISDALISRFIRAINRGYLKFGESPAATPSPDKNTQYLLYLHIPFCAVLCPFCSFHRVLFKEDRAARYFSALRDEIRNVTAAGFRFNEVYIGGGTPTVMPGELIETVRLVRELHDVGQISVETNPDDLENDRLPTLRDVGVNRLSVGVQSFDDQLLREMQRYDKYGSGEKIVRRLKRIEGEFETLNVDMIFNLPHQTQGSLKFDLQVLTDDVKVDQVSFYPLMATDSTVRSMQKDMGTVDHHREKGFYQQIVEHMLQAGYKRSSAWCFSREHGMIDEYIVEQEQYLGLGSGAFSYLGGSIYGSTFSINHYLKLVESGQTGIVRQRSVDSVDRMRYFLMMRMFGGSLDLSEAEERFDGNFARSLRAELTGLRLIGAISGDERHLKLTERGYYIWVIMMREFFTGVNSLREEMRLNISSESEMFTVGSEGGETNNEQSRSATGI